MAQIDLKSLSMEQIKKAMACKNADELIAFAKGEGFELTQDEAKAYLKELQDVELDDKTLGAMAGGRCYGESYCTIKGC